MTSWWMAALGVPGVPAAVFAAAFAGLRRVARTRDQDVKRRWRDAADALPVARDELRVARAGRKKAAAKLADEKRRLKREQKAAGKSQSSPMVPGDPAHAAALAEARRAVDTAGRTLEDKKDEARRHRDAVAVARDKLRKYATASCRAWRQNVLKKSRGTIDTAWREGFKQLWDFLREYMSGWFTAGKTGLKLLKEHYAIAASAVPLGLTLITVFVELLHYSNFDLHALPFYTSASLPALVSTALMMLLVIVLSFAVFLLGIVLSFAGVRSVFWLLILAVAGLAWTLLVVFSPLPLLVSRSVLCARLAAPAPESEAQ